MEIMNNVKNNVAVNDALAFLENLSAEADKKIEDSKVALEKVAENREEIFLHDTVFATVVASRGYIGSMTLSKDNEVANAPTVTKAEAKGMKLTGPESTLAGVLSTLNSAVNTDMMGGKKHLTIYANSFEIPRLSGMLGRLNKGDEKTYMTAAEAKFVEGRIKKYGENYEKIAMGTFMKMKEALKAGLKLRFVGFDALSGYAPKYRLPLEVAGQECEFKNGWATLKDGRRFSVAVRLNGKHKLVNADGRIVVERAVKEGSEQELAQKMFSVTSRFVSAEASREAAERQAQYEEAAELLDGNNGEEQMA